MVLITIVTGAFVNQRSHHNGGPHIVGIGFPRAIRSLRLRIQSLTAYGKWILDFPRNTIECQPRILLNHGFMTIRGAIPPNSHDLILFFNGTFQIQQPKGLGLSIHPGLTWYSFNIHGVLWNRAAQKKHPFSWDFPWNKPFILRGTQWLWKPPFFFERGGVKIASPTSPKCWEPIAEQTRTLGSGDVYPF